MSQHKDTPAGRSQPTPAEVEELGRLLNGGGHTWASTPRKQPKRKLFVRRGKAVLSRIAVRTRLQKHPKLISPFKPSKTPPTEEEV